MTPVTPFFNVFQHGDMGVWVLSLTFLFDGDTYGGNFVLGPLTMTEGEAEALVKANVEVAWKQFIEQVRLLTAKGFEN